MNKPIDKILAKAKDKAGEMKASVKKKDSAKKASKKIEHGLSKNEVNALLDKPFVKTILQEGGPKHLICYKLDQEGCTTKEIMAITNSPYQSTKRNIWQYTSGKLKMK